MIEHHHSDGHGISRRRVLRATGGAVALSGFGSSVVAGEGSADERCPEATIRPNIVHYDDSFHGGCAAAATTEALQSGVRQSLKNTYPTVGSLLEAGFIPYFDFFTEGTVSHWINPTFLGDDAVLDPARPESILVDHTWWRPIGVMYVATEDGDRIDPPPVVSRTAGEEGAGDGNVGDGEAGDGETDDGEAEDHGSICRPWHTHVGLPGRYAWWKYRMVYEDGGGFPCRTPWMMHVWRYAQEEGVYDHAPPTDRGGSPAEPPGFDTDADPDEEALGPQHLPDAVRDWIEDLWDRSA